jgi:alanine-glyoxylate transaminase/serine-glyoxylate transaminase/serine-pyruvate transaminase
MAFAERVLMGPGPSNPYPEVMAALSRPVLGHLDPQFLGILDETCERLRTVFGTANRLTFPVSGTGSAGMEAALANVVHPGDVVVVGVNGLFGERMCQVTSRLGGEVVRVEAPWGEPLDPAALLGAHPSPSVIALVHAETSTGVRNDVAAVAAGKGDALVLADTVTSLGGIEVALDDWGVDIAYGGTQKCLGVPPGLAPLTVGDRALARRVDPPVSWYFDLGLIAGYVEGATGRTYHHTAPVSMIFALHAGLGVVLDEGLAASWARHEACGRMLQDGLEAMGLELAAAKGHRLPQLTTVRVPEDIPCGRTEAEVRSLLLERYDIEIGGGVGPLAGKVWRIGCMGHGARRGNVTLLLGALGEVLQR